MKNVVNLPGFCPRLLPQSVVCRTLRTEDNVYRSFFNPRLKRPPRVAEPTLFASPLRRSILTIFRVHGAHTTGSVFCVHCALVACTSHFATSKLFRVLFLRQTHSAFFFLYKHSFAGSSSFTLLSLKCRTAYRRGTRSLVFAEISRQEHAR